MADSPKSMPTPETPERTQPGGEGIFSRCEMAWGRIRRSYLRAFRPGHVARWRALRHGTDERFDREVIDPRDLKYIQPGCRFWFRPEDDVYARREHLGFARWGYAELVGFSLCLVAFMGLFSFLAGSLHWSFLILAALILLVEVEILWFFRDPPRVPLFDPSAVVSPADGTISHVETINDPDFAEPMLRISIFLSIFNVHVNRVPRTGRVTAVRYFRGEFLDARHAECARRNEQLWLDMIDAATGAPVRLKQVSGAIARRIVCKLKAGDQIKVAERFGMIKFGSRTDLLLPARFVDEVLVRAGDKVHGVTTVLLRIKRT
jgi:phosphatidylserine decarboxylase